MALQPYLIFDGRCDEAIEFYTKAVGAKLERRLRFRDNPDMPPPGAMPPGSDDKVMHAELSIAGGTMLLSDGHTYEGRPNFDSFSLAMIVPDVETAKKNFAALTEGGQVTMPIGKTFFSPMFGMCVDKFGVGWMVLVQA